MLASFVLVVESEIEVTHVLEDGAIFRHQSSRQTVDLKHYVKIDLKYDTRQIVIRLLEMGDTINLGVCKYGKDGIKYRGPCIHPAYYNWLDQLIAGVPIAFAKIAFIKSLK